MKFTVGSGLARAVPSQLLVTKFMMRVFWQLFQAPQCASLRLNGDSEPFTVYSLGDAQFAVIVSAQNYDSEDFPEKIRQPWGTPCK